MQTACTVNLRLSNVKYPKMTQPQGSAKSFYRRRPSPSIPRSTRPPAAKLIRTVGQRSDEFYANYFGLNAL